MRIVLLCIGMIWVVPLAVVMLAAVAAGVSRRARRLLHRTLVTG